MLVGGEDDRGGGIGLGRDPRTVEGVRDQEERHHQHYEPCYLGGKVRVSVYVVLTAPM